MEPSTSIVVSVIASVVIGTASTVTYVHNTFSDKLEMNGRFERIEYRNEKALERIETKLDTLLVNIK